MSQKAYNARIHPVCLLIIESSEYLIELNNTILETRYSSPLSAVFDISHEVFFLERPVMHRTTMAPFRVDIGI